MFPPTGQTLGHYRLLGRIGRGGMGQVFRARDTRLQRDVAIKILHGDARRDDRTWRRLLREARAAAALSHPSIVTVHSVEELGDLCFIVMELVEGVTLAERLAAGPLALAELCEIGAQIGDALAAAHAAGIIHHDVTPRNILLSGGSRAKLADFGLSRPVRPHISSLESALMVHQVAGTMYYMSPEQGRGDVCTPRTDLFSLGSVLYQAATGRRPFEGTSWFAVLNAIETVDPPPPSIIRSELPPALDRLLSRLLAKRVEDRTIDAGGVAQALRAMAASPGGGGRTSTDARHARMRDGAPFVGRAQELADMSAALSRAVAGEGTMVVITGEAGIGKTALLDAFLHAPPTLAANALVCRGQSVEYSGAGEAYLPVIDALAPMVANPGEALHEIVRIHAPSWRAQFRAMYVQDQIDSTPPPPARLARELGDALCAAAGSRPVVIIVEDLHWADPSTVELLRHLAHRAARAALLIIATCRAELSEGAGSMVDQLLTELEARSACERIELSPLDEGSIKDYVESRFGPGDHMTALVSALWKSTEGHPLFLVSLVQLFVQRGDVQRIGDEWRLTAPADKLHLAIPRTVQAVIRRKLAGLTEADRRLLQYASIEGQDFSTAVLSALLGADAAALEERLDSMAKSARIVAAVGPERYAEGTWGVRYRFAHAIYHKVVYDDLTPSRRADLHRQVAQRLTALHSGRTEPIAAQLARHFKEGRDSAHAFEHYLQAGDNSMRLSARLEADAHYSQALALADAESALIEPRRIAVVRWKRGITRSFLGRHHEALADCRDALVWASKAGDADLIFDIRLGMIYAHVLAEHTDEPIEIAAELERSAEPPPGGLKRLRYLIVDLQLKMGRGELDKAGAGADQAVALARSLGDSERLWHSLSAHGQLDYYRGEYALALPQLEEVCQGATAIMRLLADPRSLNIYFHGTCYLGLTLGDLGEVSDALAALHTGLEVARRDEYAYWIPRLLNAIGWLYGEIGAFDAARQYDEDAVAAGADQNTHVQVESRLNLARDCLNVWQPDRAARLIADAETLAAEDVWYAWLSRIHFAIVAAEHALAHGAPSRATELAREGAEQAHRLGVRRFVVITERILAEAASAEDNWARAGEHLRNALDILTLHPIPIVEWKVYATAVGIHRHRGLDAEASAALERARSSVHHLADSIREEPLKSIFLESWAVRQVLDDCGPMDVTR